MSPADATQFLDGLRASRLLDDRRLDEIQSTPGVADSIDSLSSYVRERGWLTPYQFDEVAAGRGGALAIGGYRLQERLSDDAGGTTYKATHPALPDPVALRVVRLAWLDPGDTATEYVARTQAACLVSDPYLTNVLDAGTYAEAPFVVQEFVDGCDLFRLVNEMGALPVPLACEYVRQAAIGLRAAHDKGIVHGAVSPHTILLSPVKRVADPATGYELIRPRAGATARLTDLALAPRRPPLVEIPYGQTEALGAVEFLPPERLASGDRDVTGDLYGLGATLYFLFSARPPVVGASPAETLVNLRDSVPPPVERLRSDVPTAVADVVRRLLEREPLARPGTGEVIDILFPFCEPSAFPSEPPGEEVLVASETFTKVAAAAPVEVGDPLVEPLDERRPSSHGDVDPFGHDPMSAEAIRPRRRKAKATRRHVVWIVAGLLLHLTALLLLIGWATNWYAFLMPADPADQKQDQKDEPKKTGKKKPKS